MRPLRTITLGLLLTVFACVSPAAPFPVPGFQVAGAVAKPAVWQPKTLSDQFKSSLQSIRYTRKGVKHTAHALPLLTVLQAAQPKINPQIKNHLLQFVVLVSGHDGYTVAFSMAELSPDFGKRAVWLTLDEDGRPLERPGETNLVVPEDVKAGRWVHIIERVTVVDDAQAAPADGR